MPATRIVWLLALLAAFVVFVILEGRRQERKYGKRGTAGRAMREGLLELQGQLEPDRKIEIVRQAERDRDLLVDVDGKGEPPKR